MEQNLPEIDELESDLQFADRMVAHIFAHTPAVEPSTGFANRWEARLAADQKRENRQQALKILAIILLSAVGVFAMFWTRLLVELRFIPLMVLSWLQRMEWAYTLWNTLQASITGILKYLPGAMMLPLWLSAWGLAWGLGAIWFVRRRMKQRRWTST